MTMPMPGSPTAGFDPTDFIADPETAQLLTLYKILTGASQTAKKQPMAGVGDIFGAITDRKKAAARPISPSMMEYWEREANAGGNGTPVHFDPEMDTGLGDVEGDFDRAISMASKMQGVDQPDKYGSAQDTIMARLMAKFGLGPDGTPVNKPGSEYAPSQYPPGAYDVPVPINSSIKPPFSGAAEKVTKRPLTPEQALSQGGSGIDELLSPFKAGAGALKGISQGKPVFSGSEPGDAWSMVNEILGRAKSKVPRGPQGRASGGSVEGPTILRVGERPAGDKKYATEEVVLAGPGTVVAPVPKGMENPSEEDALGLIIAQLAKTPGREAAPRASEGRSDNKLEGAATGHYSPASYEAAAQIGQDRSTKRKEARDFSWGQTQYFQNRDRQNTVNDRDYQRRGYEDDRNFKYKQNVDFEPTNPYRLRSEMSWNGGGRGGSGSESSNASARWQQEFSQRQQEHQDELRNWEAERALKRELGMGGLDIDRTRTANDYQLSAAQQAFQQIMAGITGSAMPGVRAGRTPMLGLFG